MAEVFSSQWEEHGEKNRGIFFLFFFVLFFFTYQFIMIYKCYLKKQSIKPCRDKYTKCLQNKIYFKHVSVDRLPKMPDFSVTSLLCYGSQVIFDFIWSKLSKSGFVADSNFCFPL